MTFFTHFERNNFLKFQLFVLKKFFLQFTIFLLLFPNLLFFMKNIAFFGGWDFDV